VAHDDEPDDAPSIAPPSLGSFLRRRRTKAPDPAPEPPRPAPVIDPGDPAGGDDDAAAAAETILDAPDQPVDPAPGPVAEPEPAVVPVVADPDPEPQPAAPEPGTPLQDRPTAPLAGAIEQGNTEHPTTIFEADDEPVAQTAEPVAEPEPAVVPLVPGLDAEQPTQQPTEQPTREQRKPTTPVAPQRLPRAERPPQPEREPRPPREITLPTWLTGPVAAVVVGLVVGIVLVLLTALSSAACDVVRGTTSCGRGPGLLLLVAILAVGVLVGALLLRLVGSEGPTSTSLLAVGLLAVVVMLFLLDSVDAGWMALVVPVLAALTYLGSWWATVAFTDVDV
jgi:hypothetical protein